MNLSLSKWKWAKFAKLAAIARRQRYRRALLSTGVAAGVEHQKVLSLLQCGMVVDIGANRGQFALVARQCFPAARIVSFEPLASPALKFRKAFAGDALTTLHETAIGPDSGQTTIYISGRDDSSSLLPITEKQATLFAGTGEVATGQIKVAPLALFLTESDVVAPPLLKLDVQGYELQVLQGCAALLAQFKYVYAECSFLELYQGQALANEVIAWLHERGFRLQGVYNMTYDSKTDGAAVQADFLFLRG